MTGLILLFITAVHCKDSHFESLSDSIQLDNTSFEFTNPYRSDEDESRSGGGVYDFTSSTTTEEPENVTEAEHSEFNKTAAIYEIKQDWFNQTLENAIVGKDKEGNIFIRANVCLTNRNVSDILVKVDFSLDIELDQDVSPEMCSNKTIEFLSNLVKIPASKMTVVYNQQHNICESTKVIRIDRGYDRHIIAERLLMKCLESGETEQVATTENLVNL